MSTKSVGTQYDSLSIKISNAIPVIKAALNAKRVPMLWGSYGVGKTSIAKQIGLEMEYDSVIILSPSQDDIIDYKLPYLDEKNGEKVSAFALSERLPREGRHLLFIDEINTASMMLQPTLYSLTLEGSIGKYRMPNACGRIAAGNREADKCAANTMSAALKDRMAPHINIVPDSESWCSWAFQHNIRQEVIAFVKDMPEVLEKCDPSDPCGGCTPRSLESLSHLLNAGLPFTSEDVVIRGTIGAAMGAKFDGYLKLFRGKVDIESIIKNPDKAPLPEKGDVRYAICTALSYKLSELTDVSKKENSNLFKNIITYLSRLEKTYLIMTVMDAVKVNNKLKGCKYFIDLCLKYEEILI